MKNESAVYALAADIDRLAYMLDPFEYWDVVGRSEEDIRSNVSRIAEDLMAGNTNDYSDWLWELSEDANLSDRDRERVRDRLNRLIGLFVNV